MAFCRLLGGRRMLSCNGSFRVLLQQNTREGPSTGPMETTSPSLKLKQSFQLLGLNQGECSLEDIKKAYISLAKKHHPDSNLLGEAADQFFRIRCAYIQCTSYAKNTSLTLAVHDALEEELQNMDQSLGLRKYKTTSSHFSHDGVGTGTFSQRETAYTQEHLDQASFDQKLVGQKGPVKMDSLASRKEKEDDVEENGKHSDGGPSVGPDGVTNRAFAGLVVITIGIIVAIEMYQHK